MKKAWWTAVASVVALTGIAGYKKQMPVATAVDKPSAMRPLLDITAEQAVTIPPFTPTRPSRATRPPDQPVVPDYSFVIDKPMPIEQFYGRYCQYFEMQLHAHRKSTGEDFTNGVTFKLQNGGGTISVDANGLMKGNAQPPPDSECGDEFILQVEPQ